MPSQLSTSMQIDVLGTTVPSLPQTGNVNANMQTTTRWTHGTASGQADRQYHKERSLAASATHNYDLLAAGSLTDVLSQAIDLDELKGLKIKCTVGAIKVVGGAGTPAGFLTAATEGFNLAAGHEVGFNFGAAGLNVATNSKFDVTDTAGGSGSTYEITFFGAQ